MPCRHGTGHAEHTPADAFQPASVDFAVLELAVCLSGQPTLALGVMIIVLVAAAPELAATVGARALTWALSATILLATYYIGRPKLLLVLPALVAVCVLLSPYDCYRRLPTVVGVLTLVYFYSAVSTTAAVVYGPADLRHLFVILTIVHVGDIAAGFC